MFIIESDNIDRPISLQYSLGIPSLNPIPSITIFIHCGAPTDCETVSQWRTADLGEKLWGEYLS